MRILIIPFVLFSFFYAPGALLAAAEEKPKNVETEDGLKNPTELVEQDNKHQQPEADQDGEGSSSVERQEAADSADNDSVSKYNFIFYFLYKFNYDSDGEELKAL